MNFAGASSGVVAYTLPLLTTEVRRFAVCCTKIAETEMQPETVACRCYRDKPRLPATSSCIALPRQARQTRSSRVPTTTNRFASSGVPRIVVYGRQHISYVGFCKRFHCGASQDGNMRVVYTNGIATILGKRKSGR